MKFLSHTELGKRSEEYKFDQSIWEKVSEMNGLMEFKRKQYNEKFANLFLFGVPRSGTTLTYQLIVSGTNISYINNLIARFWESPEYGVYLSKSLNVPRRVSFQSSHGVTDTISDVHEFGYFWASLLNQKSNDCCLGKRDFSAIDVDILKAKVLSLNHAFGQACCYKSVLVGHYAALMSRILDKSYFIYLVRDPLEVVKSIYRVRRERYGDLGCWWSTKPAGAEEWGDLSPVEQIVKQVYSLSQDYVDQLSQISSNRKLVINYKDVVNDPGMVLDSIINLRMKGWVNSECYPVRSEGRVKRKIYQKEDINRVDLALMENLVSDYFSGV